LGNYADGSLIIALMIMDTKPNKVDLKGRMTFKYHLSSISTYDMRERESIAFLLSLCTSIKNYNAHYTLEILQDCFIHT